MGYALLKEKPPIGQNFSASPKTARERAANRWFSKEKPEVKGNLASGRIVYYRARYYDPEVGRFLTEDPLGFRAGISFYAYVLNNPINANDPTGLDADVTVSGNNVQIELPISYSGSGATSKITQQMNKGIEKQWTGKIGKYDVTTTVTEGSILDFDTNNISVPSGNGRAFVRGVGGDSGVWPGKSTTGWVAGHEAGHLLGLPDQYKDVTVGGVTRSVANPGFGTNVMGCYGAIGVREQDVTNIIDANKSVFQKAWDGIKSFFTPSLSPSPSPVVGANGGFVLYPSKPNLNMMNQVYSK